MTREQWLKVYRIARQPDIYLSDDVILKFPVRWLMWAEICLKARGE